MPHTVDAAKRRAATRLAALAVLGLLALAGCGGGGLSRAEVEDLVRAEVAAVPPKSAPQQYTRWLVQSAIAFHQAHGLDAAVARYSDAASVDGQWYVFIVDENDLVVAHPDPGRVGLDLKGWVGTDANGYEYGPELLSAAEHGKWVSYVYNNPENGPPAASGDFELKNVWAQRHEGLLFASGWYIQADQFAEQLVATAVQKYRQTGLAGTIAYFAGAPDEVAGLEAAVAYYNTADTVEGHWFALIGDPNGKIAAHSNPAMIGRNTQDILGADPHPTAEGKWVETQTLRSYTTSHDNHTFATGWHLHEHQ